jgi:hypothetical protein
MCRLYALLIGIGLLIPSFAVSQEAPGAGLGVRSGQLVRVKSADGQMMEGRFSWSPARDPVLQLSDAQVLISNAAIDSVWVRGNRSGTGALIGGLVFGAGSAALGWFACEIGSDGHGCQETGQVLGFTALGTGVGVGLGALIGSAFGTWHLTYKRPGASVRLSPVSLDRVVLDVRLPL